MLTVERAAEMVKKIRTVDRDCAMDLFVHFVDVLGIDSLEFAILCEYPIATNVQRVDEDWLELMS